MRKFRLVVEYELDDPETTVEKELECWMTGELTPQDVIGCGMWYRIETSIVGEEGLTYLEVLETEVKD